MNLLEEVSFVNWLSQDCGYGDIRPLNDGRYVAIRQFLFTHAIIVGQIGDRCGVDDRWCYHSYAAAKTALCAWDGTGEPLGWHRHPASGRRRIEGEPTTEYVSF